VLNVLDDVRAKYVKEGLRAGVSKSSKGRKEYIQNHHSRPYLLYHLTLSRGSGCRRSIKSMA
jgi:hypothetical protein